MPLHDESRPPSFLEKDAERDGRRKPSRDPGTAFLLELQRTAGNAAVSAALAPTQRASRPPTQLETARQGSISDGRVDGPTPLSPRPSPATLVPVQRGFGSMIASLWNRLFGTRKASVAAPVRSDQQSQIAKDVARDLGTVLEAIEVKIDSLRDMGSEEIRERYLTRVHVPLSLLKRTQTDRERREQLQRVEDAAAQLRDRKPKQLPEELAAVLDKVQEAGITDKLRLNELQAPRYTAGGTLEEQVAPSLEGWGPQNRVLVSGNADFREKVKRMIDVIAETDVGRSVLKGIGGDAKSAVEGQLQESGHHEAKQIVATIQPPAAISVSYQVPETAKRSGPRAGADTYMYGNSTGSDVIGFDPDNDVTGTLEEAKEEAWCNRDAVIGLFHELVHVYLYRKKGEIWTQDGEELHVGDQGDAAELRIVGVRYQRARKDGKGAVEYRFDDPKLNPITENEFRRQYAAKKGSEVYRPRPIYRKGVGGQVALDPGEKRVLQS